MTDYSKLKLTVTSSPHLHGPVATWSIMLDVILATLPALAYASFWFGFRSLVLTGISVASCLVWEFLYCLVRRKRQSIGDFSAVVTGILLVFVCPADIAWWKLLLASLVAVVVVKQLFGGIGRNLLNPALAGSMLVLLCFGSAGETSEFFLNVEPPFGGELLAGQTEAAALAPMSYLRGEDLAAAFRQLTEEYSLLDIFLGKTGGALGEVCVLALLAGGIYLLGRRIISWHIPVGCIAAVAVLTVLFPRGGADNLQWMLYNLCSGSLMLGAFFMATDYATSPVTDGGRLLYGVGCGVLTVLMRYFVSPERGVYYAILVMNCATPLLDRVLRPLRFGARD